MKKMLCSFSWYPVLNQLAFIPSYPPSFLPASSSFPSFPSPPTIIYSSIPLPSFSLSFSTLSLCLSIPSFLLFLYSSLILFAAFISMSLKSSFVRQDIHLGTIGAGGVHIRDSKEALAYLGSKGFFPILSSQDSVVQPQWVESTWALGHEL